MLEENRLIRSFGRIKSRKLSDNKKNLLGNLLPEYEIKTLDASKKTHLEIGFGFGDFLFETAKNNPDILHIGCEPHINGVVNLLAKLEKEPLKNIRILTSDSRPFLENLPDDFLNQVYVLFPDPWPKSKHYKRRLINVKFLQLLASKMNKGSKLIIASDHDAYKDWIITEVLKSGLFNWSARSKKDWQNFPAWWVETKYQKKARAEGRDSIYLEFNLI